MQLLSKSRLMQSVPCSCEQFEGYQSPGNAKPKSIKQEINPFSPWDGNSYQQTLSVNIHAPVAA